MLDGDQRAIRMAYSLAFSLPGTPVLFYGEEIGMAENLEIEGRYAVRAPMQWSGDGGFTTSDEPCRTLVDGEWGPQRINVADQRRDPGSLLNWFERLIRRRRECPELGFGTLTVLEIGVENVLAHRCDWEGATVVAVHELSGKPVSVQLPLDDGAELVDLFEDASHPLPASLDLEPYAAHWFRIRRDGIRLPP
jgi:maltose alpha-D-glucosyltransferase/alpha-amylase